tara:strand:+ start:511 stop:1236 length:726 start_codon:yes stop_codon:yes gene_type:complete
MSKDSVPLIIEGVSKRFGTHQVLDAINLQVNSGQIYGLVGVNGAGKTTLIKIILNLLSACSGKVSFFGKNASLDKSRQHIAYLPEKFQPSGLLKGKEFLSLALSYHGQSFDINKARNKAEQLHLDPQVLDHRVGRYSKGMGQKLGLLSMFLLDVPLLILDEPMSGLDPKARIELKSMLKAYTDQGNSVFFSSHILSDIEEICDEVAIIHNANFVYQGSVDGFLAKYKDQNLEHAFLTAIAA